MEVFAFLTGAAGVIGASTGLFYKVKYGAVDALSERKDQTIRVQNDQIDAFSRQIEMLEKDVKLMKEEIKDLSGKNAYLTQIATQTPQIIELTTAINKNNELVAMQTEMLKQIMEEVKK